MHARVFAEELNDITEDIGYVSHLKNMPRQKRAGKARPVRPHPEEIRQSGLHDHNDDEFQISYHAAKHEAIWLKESLEDFFHQQWFDDVLRLVKGGKEASVYLCQGNASTGVEHIAAKVYRPRRFRSLKNDWLYREGRGNLDESGRKITNRGMQHAMEKRTDYGRELLHTSWLEHEFQSLTVLHHAGADVPKPFAAGPNAILMSYYGDEVMGAPTLNDVELAPREARPLFERVVHNIDLMLSLGLIHGDLSAFNILHWDGEIVLIDFPQIVRPNENRSAYRIFERDVIRVCEYFQRQGIGSDPRKLAVGLWEKHNRRFIPLVDPKVISEDRDDERDIWESLRNA